MREATIPKCFTAWKKQVAQQFVTMSVKLCVSLLTLNGTCMGEGRWDQWTPLKISWLKISKFPLQVLVTCNTSPEVLLFLAKLMAKDIMIRILCDLTISTQKITKPMLPLLKLLPLPSVGGLAAGWNMGCGFSIGSKPLQGLSPLITTICCAGHIRWACNQWEMKVEWSPDSLSPDAELSLLLFMIIFRVRKMRWFKKQLTSLKALSSTSETHRLRRSTRKGIRPFGSLLKIPLKMIVSLQVAGR